MFFQRKNIITGLIVVFFLLLTGLILLMFNKQKSLMKALQAQQQADTAMLDDPAPNRLLPEKLRDIPDGITGFVTPNPVAAGYVNGNYKWTYSSIIRSVSTDLTLTEFGNYFYTDKGWKLNIVLPAENFEKQYGCKDAVLKKGVDYKNQSLSFNAPVLEASDQLWYFIGKDPEGNLKKGVLFVQLEAVIRKDSVANTSNTNQDSSVIRELRVDPVKSVLRWTGFGAVGNYSLTGDIRIKNGNLTIKDGNILAGNVVIDMTSLHHETEDLQDHLRSKDFFDVELFPVSGFTLTRAQYVNEDSLKLTGNLTIRKATRQISFGARLILGKNNIHLKGKATVDRTAFGIRYGSTSFFSNLGDDAIKDNFELMFDIEAIE